MRLLTNPEWHAGEAMRLFDMASKVQNLTGDYSAAMLYLARAQVHAQLANYYKDNCDD